MNQVQSIIALLWEFLGPVKREQARAALGVALKSYREGPGSPRHRDHCKNGHRWDAENTIHRVLNVKGKRYSIRHCRSCIHDRHVARTAKFLLSA